MIRYWTNFARAGDPNGDGLPAWQPYRTTAPATQSLGTGPGGIKPVDFAVEHRLPFWSRMP